jgi:hypothetical protein
MDEMASYWRQFHSEELHNLNSSDIIRMIKSRRSRWASVVTGMREMRNAYKISFF